MMVLYMGAWAQSICMRIPLSQGCCRQDGIPQESPCTRKNVKYGAAVHIFLPRMVTGDRELRCQGSREKAEELAHELLDIFWWGVEKA